MKALHIRSHAKDVNNIRIDIQEVDLPKIRSNEVLIKVEAAGVNASDALAAIGYFDHASIPRIPGRDFGGTIVEGPKEIIGKRVWGTGGAAGIDFNGTHSQYIALPVNAVSEIPNTLSFEQAGSVTLPYVTAYYALIKRAQLLNGEDCLITGALGQVGRAAMSIATWLGANPVGVVRDKNDLDKAQTLGFQAVNSEQSDFGLAATRLINSKRFSVILNSLGSIYWDQLIDVLSEEGRLATIGAPPDHRSVEVNLFKLYRSNQSLIGINTVALDYIYNAGLLNELRKGFEKSVLIAPSKEEMLVFPMEKAIEAYQAVLNSGIKKRVVLTF